MADRKIGHVFGETCPVFCPRKGCKRKCRRERGHEKGIGATRHLCLNFDSPHTW